MEMNKSIYWVFGLIFLVSNVRRVRGGDVTYDGRSLIIDGERKILFSGSIHYPRSTPEMWPSLISKAKEGGIDVIETYVFWNLHEPQPGQYDFSGRYDLVKFIKEIQSQGLYACLRIGPFIEAEWNYGGFPFWLRDVPGIVYRTDNEPFQFYMQNFTTKIVNLMKSEGLYAPQGGPIILSQIENEYGNIEGAFHERGAAYVRWAAKMAVGLNTGVPWIMCKQPDAPDPVINTCNGMRCGETFAGPNSPKKPKMWTENWTSFFQVFGGKPYIRSAQDIAFHVALFVAKNGSYVNYYMFHGGTNFGRTSASFFLTGYYDQAPLDEYGLLRQPKYGHLKELHAAIKGSSKALLLGVPTNFSLGQSQEAYIFEEKTGGCVAFLVNNNGAKVTARFRNMSFRLHPHSISILQDCKTEIFNSAYVTTETNSRMMRPNLLFDAADRWEAFRDMIPNIADTQLRENLLLEHTNMTKDKTDYLWYTFRFKPKSSCTRAMLHVVSLGHVIHVFINGSYGGAAHGGRDVNKVIMDTPIQLNVGMNYISILSGMVGLPNAGAYLERKSAGLTDVEIRCAETRMYDFTKHTWGYQAGLLGEKSQIYDQNGTDNVQWSKNVTVFRNQPLTWYRIFFDAPGGNDPVALNLTTMGKGEAWVNGQSIGRYWVSFRTPQGHISQAMYHIPRSFLKNTGNLLVIFEEYGGDPLGISLDTISVVSVHRRHDSRPRRLR